MILFNQVTIIGVGLMGGSLARAIKQKGLSERIVGFFRAKNRLDKAMEGKIVDQGYLDLSKALEGSDLVVLALPVSQIIDILPRIRQIAGERVIVIDVGSTKHKISQVADKLGLNFVGTHPLCGSEKKGFDYSSEKFFLGSQVLLTPTLKTNKRVLVKVKLLWEKLGAQVKVLTAQEHDKIIAWTSHLPHLVSFSLIDVIPFKYLSFGASGLKDTTRIALSDAELWVDIFLDNKKELLSALVSFERNLKRLSGLVSRGRKKQLMKLLSSCQNKRKRLI